MKYLISEGINIRVKKSSPFKNSHPSNHSFLDRLRLSFTDSCVKYLHILHFSLIMEALLRPIYIPELKSPILDPKCSNRKNYDIRFLFTSNYFIIFYTKESI